MPEPSSRLLNIWLVADDLRQRGELRQAFAVSPYLRSVKEIGTNEARAALSGSATLESFCRPDLMILDLPGSQAQGLQASLALLKEIKTRANLRGIPVVLLAEEGTLRRFPACREACFCSIVKKPADPEGFRKMAYHFGEYWGTVARVPVRSDDSRGADNEEAAAPATGLFASEAQVGMARRPIEIMVVDDNGDDAILFQESLSALEQIRVSHMFDDPEPALECLRKQGRFREAAAPDLVVLDIHMPRRSGLHLLDEIKEDDFLRKFPVVMLTASRYEEDIWESYSRGACSFLEKPPRFEWFRELAVRFANYWSSVAHLPDRFDD